MPARKPPDPNAKPQIEKFREMARELGCDEDEAAFDAVLRQVAQHKPRDVPAPVKGTRSVKKWNA